MPPKIPPSKQKVSLCSRFNVGVCCAVGLSVLLLANYSRLTHRPTVVLSPSLQASAKEQGAVGTGLHPKTVDDINAASVGVTSTGDSLGETPEPEPAASSGKRKKRKKKLWEVVEDEIMSDGPKSTPDKGADGAGATDAKMEEVYSKANEHELVDQEIFTKVKDYDDNQHFYDCGDSTTDWRVADVVNRYEDYVPKNSKIPNQRYFIASVLHNDVRRVPAFTREVIKLVRLLRNSPVFVSIYEASSTDGTRVAIQPLVHVLETLNVAHRVVHGNEVRSTEQSKANFVASLRNKAMEPLYDEDTTWMYFDKVIFLDGSFFCGFDVVEMLMYKEANIICGMDVGFATGEGQNSDLVLRDPSALKDLNGKPFSAIYPYASMSESVDAMMRNQPFRVYSCFDGVAVFDAAPMHTHGVRFREPGLSDCAVGQGSLLSKDLWERGFLMHIVLPTVRTAQDPDAWQLLASRKAHLMEVMKDEAPLNKTNLTEVAGHEFDKPRNVLCCPIDANGEHHSLDCRDQA